MKKEKMILINRISGICFLLSSLNLLVIPFLDTTGTLDPLCYIVASLFWSGLLIGLGMQIFLSLKCKKMKKKKWKNQKLFYIISAVAFIIVILLAILNIDVMFFFSLMLFVSIISLETSVVIKKEMYLKWSTKN